MFENVSKLKCQATGTEATGTEQEGGGTATGTEEEGGGMATGMA